MEKTPYSSIFFSLGTRVNELIILINGLGFIKAKNASLSSPCREASVHTFCFAGIFFCFASGSLRSSAGVSVLRNKPECFLFGGDASGRQIGSKICKIHLRYTCQLHERPLLFIRISDACYALCYALCCALCYALCCAFCSAVNSRN